MVFTSGVLRFNYCFPFYVFSSFWMWSKILRFNSLATNETFLIPLSNSDNFSCTFNLLMTLLIILFFLLFPIDFLFRYAHVFLVTILVRCVFWGLHFWKALKADAWCDFCLLQLRHMGFIWMKLFGIKCWVEAHVEIMFLTIVILIWHSLYSSYVTFFTLVNSGTKTSWISQSAQLGIFTQVL